MNQNKDNRPYFHEISQEEIKRLIDEKKLFPM